MLVLFIFQNHKKEMALEQEQKLTQFVFALASKKMDKTGTI